MKKKKKNVDIYTTNPSEYNQPETGNMTELNSQIHSPLNTS
jgi:hypothetical protein